MLAEIFIKQLKKQKGKDIWLIGGGQINTMLLNENLIDEIQIFTMPIIISNGIELFEVLPKETNLKLIETKPNSTVVVELKYKVL
ncbi:MAG: dihydrofolate reductase family protein [Flavobacteriales bacterium]|nr:dihydrofolate reductase family protein [Flavobacteriales bacterium]